MYPVILFTKESLASLLVVFVISSFSWLTIPVGPSQGVRGAGNVLTLCPSQGQWGVMSPWDFCTVFIRWDSPLLSCCWCFCLAVHEWSFIRCLFCCIMLGFFLFCSWGASHWLVCRCDTNLALGRSLLLFMKCCPSIVSPSYLSSQHLSLTPKQPWQHFCGCPGCAYAEWQQGCVVQKAGHSGTLSLRWSC
jgi:hypothetical protein